MVVCVDFALLVYFDIFAMNSSGSWFKVKKASQKKTNKKEEKQEQEVYISTI
jgi:hypothetical protein